MTDRIHEATPDELLDWDARTVDAPGGDVEQSLAWSRHRARLGWRPRHLVFDDGFRVLSLERPWVLIGGSGAYLSHGPIAAGEPVTRTAERLRAAADHLAGLGVDVVSADPEIEAASGYGAIIERDGFHVIDEARSSRHRMRLPLPPGTDEGALFASFQATLRQLVRGAERSGLQVVRFDVRAGDGPDAQVGDGFVAPGEGALDASARAAFERLYDLLRAAATRRGFRLGTRRGFVDWSADALKVGHVVYLEVRDDAGEMLGGATFYRHGGRLTYSHSADRVEVRRAHPGVVRLLLWRAIQLAIRDGLGEMDLGGVDIAGARHIPVAGEPMYGLYAFKRSFGGEWVELAGNHEWVARRWRYAAGRVTGRVASLARGGPR